MALNLGREVAALKRMSLSRLRERYAQVFGETTRSRHRGFLIRRIAWRLQAMEEGGLSERARMRGQELAKGAEVRLTPPKGKVPFEVGETQVEFLPSSQDPRLPLPGALLVREYKGRTVQVRVLPRGFEFEGRVFKSLSAVTKAITGTHWNGYHFFGLGKKGKGHAKKKG